MKKCVFLTLCFLAAATLATAGPPFATDDPEPLEYRHWEVYLGSQYEHGSDGAGGTLPHFEVNYGALPNLQLHLIAPVTFDAPTGASRQFGYGDTELGAKYRFLDEADGRPQVGVFPLVELPTGDSARGLGSAHTQVFLPVWLQKKFGTWTTYGGAGYWINPGAGNRNWWFTGWLIQKEVRPGLTIGAEIFHETAQSNGAESDTKMNVGVIWDLDETRHILASVGPTIQGPVGYQAYFALQFTFGPGK
jgi:Putative MetA-pathway of phenol degradation